MGVGVGMESEMAEESPAARARPLEAVAEEGQEVAEQNPVPVAVASTKTMERVAAAKKFIEDHYRAQMKNLQERKERYRNPCALPKFFR